MVLVPWSYLTDDGMHIALVMRPDRALLMGFTPAGLGLPKRPHKFVTRKEIFLAPDGEKLLLPYPTPAIPHPFGTAISFLGKPWVAIATLDEIGTGQTH